MNVDFSDNYTGVYKLRLPIKSVSHKSVPLKQLFLQRVEYVPFSKKSVQNKSGRYLHFSDFIDVQENTIIVEDDLTDLSDK